MMLHAEDTVEIEQHFIVHASCKGTALDVQRKFQRALEKVVRRRCDTYEYVDVDEATYEWSFDTEKAARSAEKRLRAGLVTKLCKVMRLWAVKVL